MQRGKELEELPFPPHPPTHTISCLVTANLKEWWFVLVVFFSHLPLIQPPQMWLPPPSFHIGLISPDSSQSRQWSHGMKPNGLSSVLISSHLISQKQLTLPEQWLLLTSCSLGVPPTSLSVPPLSRTPPHLEFPTADPRPSHSHCPLPLSPAMSSTHMTSIATSTLVPPKFLSPAKRPSGLPPHLSNGCQTSPRGHWQGISDFMSQTCHDLPPFPPAPISLLSDSSHHPPDVPPSLLPRHLGMASSWPSCVAFSFSVLFLSTSPTIPQARPPSASCLEDCSSP